jgi:hypothetical protein
LGGKLSVLAVSILRAIGIDENLEATLTLKQSILDFALRFVISL